MDELVSLVKIMRVGEKRMLKHMLSRTTNAEENLRLRLFELLEGSGNIDDAVKPLMASTSKSSFSHLKSRLKEDILSVLLVKESSKRIAQANRAAQFECVKKIAQAYVLIFRGAKTQGAEILRSAKALAVKYELTGELLSINHIEREAFYSFSDVETIAAMNADLRDNLNVWSDILKSEELSFYITLPQFKEQLSDSKNGFEGKIIDDLNELYEKSHTSRIGFWYYMAATEFHTTRKNFETVVTLGRDFLELVEKSPAIRSKNNMAGVNQTVGFAQMELRQFAEAIKHFSVSEKLFPAGGFNRLQSLHFLALSEIGTQDVEAALLTVGKALGHPRITAREHLLPQWRFIKASVQFLLADMESCFKTLSQDGYLLKQQDEWNIQFRILEMLVLVELKDEEWLEFKLDATRKFLTRHKNLDTPRVRAAIDLISNLLRKELDFDELSEKNLELLKRCTEEAEGYEWNPSGVEMVRFDFWVEKKLPTQAAE